MMRRRKLMVIQDEDEYFVPKLFTVNLSSESVKAGKRFYLGAQTSIDVDKLIVEYQGVEYEITADNAELVDLGVADTYTYSCGFKAPNTMSKGEIITLTVRACKTGNSSKQSKPIIREITIK